jgi:hypothetical protein
MKFPESIFKELARHFSLAVCFENHWLSKQLPHEDGCHADNPVTGNKNQIILIVQSDKCRQTRKKQTPLFQLSASDGSESMHTHIPIVFVPTQGRVRPASQDNYRMSIGDQSLCQ